MIYPGHLAFAAGTQTEQVFLGFYTVDYDRLAEVLGNADLVAENFPLQVQWGFYAVVYTCFANRNDISMVTGFFLYLADSAKKIDSQYMPRVQADGVFSACMAGRLPAWQ
jgi:hypothetical protein